MTEQNRVGDLEINQDLEFQHLSWKLQRIGWGLMALLLVAALAGLLGPGPLSDTTAGEENSMLWVEYNRFERYQSPIMLKIHLGPGAAKDGKVRLWMNRDYIQNMELRHIDPEPESVEVGAESTAYVFNIADPEKSTTIFFHLEPNTRGWLPLRIGLQGGPHVSLRQFLYP